MENYLRTTGTNLEVVRTQRDVFYGELFLNRDTTESGIKWPCKGVFTASCLDI